MKPITLHPISVFAGLVLAGVVALSTGAAQLPRHVPPPEPPVFGLVPAEWWTFVALSNAQPHAVPLNRRFVVTLTSNSGFFADGQPVSSQEAVNMNYGSDRNGTRIVFPPGTVLTSNSTVQIWGYLEPVQQDCELAQLGIVSRALLDMRRRFFAVLRGSGHDKRTAYIRASELVRFLMRAT